MVFCFVFFVSSFYLSLIPAPFCLLWFSFKAGQILSYELHVMMWISHFQSQWSITERFQKLWKKQVWIYAWTLSLWSSARDMLSCFCFWNRLFAVHVFVLWIYHQTLFVMFFFCDLCSDRPQFNTSLDCLNYIIDRMDLLYFYIYYIVNGYYSVLPAR